MTSQQVVDLKGKKTGEVKLAEDVFGVKPSVATMHTALVRQLANARAGTASTKTRSEVSGGGRKPWRQKGTGRARAGSIRSPLWEGGGVAFGPKPRDYSKSMPKKMRVLALRSALAAKRDSLIVVKDFDAIKEGRTKEFFPVLKDLQIVTRKVLVILDYACDTCCKVELAARNIHGVKVLSIANLNVKDLLHADVLLTTERTIDAINKRFAGSHAKEKAPTRTPAHGVKRDFVSREEKAKEKAEKAAARPPKPKKEKAPKEDKKAKKADAAPKEEGKGKQPAKEGEAKKAKPEGKQGGDKDKAKKGK